MSYRVLVVDDEPVLADTLAEIFRRAGYRASSVYNCEDALKVIAAERPLFVISDVVMPGMNGVMLASTIRGTFPDCEVLLFSGNADTQDLLLLAREKGHEFHVLAKPVSPRRILEKVSSLLQLDKGN